MNDNCQLAVLLRWLNGERGLPRVVFQGRPVRLMTAYDQFPPEGSGEVCIAAHSLAPLVITEVSFTHSGKGALNRGR